MILGRKHTAPLVAAAAVLAVLVSAPAAVGEEARYEDRVKAEFIYNFAKFVTWPDDSLPPRDEPFVFCAIDGDPLGDVLSGLLEDRTVHRRDVAVRMIDGFGSAGECQVIYASRKGDAELTQLFATLSELPTLTVGESDAFYSSGGMIRFIVSGGRLRFDISQIAADARDLKVSSQLLKLARTVDK